MHATSRTPAGRGEQPVWPREVAEVFERAFTCEYASLTRAGVPVTWPVGPFAGAGTLDVTTGLAYPAKAERARRDPRVALLFSDPAPAGPAAPGWLAAPADWRPRADRAARFGAPVLTGAGADGWPLPLRSLGARRVDDGFVVRTGPLGATTSGQVCLTFHTHREDMSGQDGVVLMGHATPVADGVHVRVERALPDFSMSGDPFEQFRKMRASARALKPRLERELARRGRPMPVIHRPGQADRPARVSSDAPIGRLPGKR